MHATDGPLCDFKPDAGQPLLVLRFPDALSLYAREASDLILIARLAAALGKNRAAVKLRRMLDLWDAHTEPMRALGLGFDGKKEQEG